MTASVSAAGHHGQGGTNFNDRRLAGRRILITGAASGIGRSTAQLFAAHGAQLAVLDRDRERLDDIAVQTGAFACVADLSDAQSVALAVERAASAMGGIDGVVNAAGVMQRGSVLDTSVEDWRRVIDINLVGTFIVVKCALPWLMRAQDATIVNVGSAMSLLPNAPDRSAYAASKGGVLNLTRALAAELAPSIRANTVCPGLVDTPMADAVKTNVDHYALKRIGVPEEIAQTILFLTSSESSYVTGAALAVDGGRSFH